MIKQFEERQERIRFRKALKSEARGKANYRSDSESLSDFITDDDDSDANKKVFCIFNNNVKMQ
jgi:hypothetical protein